MLIMVQIRYAGESSVPSAGFMRVDAICYAGQRPAKMGFKFKKKEQHEIIHFNKKVAISSSK